MLNLTVGQPTNVYVAGLMCPRWENSNADAMENLNMLVRGHRHINLDGIVINIGSSIYTETCEMDTEMGLGICWINLEDIIIDMDSSAPMTFKMQKAKIKVRVFFQPDSFEVYSFEDPFVPSFSLYRGDEASGKQKSSQATGDQRSSAERLLLRAPNQPSLRCYRNQIVSNLQEWLSTLCAWLQWFLPQTPMKSTQ